MTRRIERLVLHVGMHRAGSTLVQRTLAANRQWLRGDGVAFIDHDSMRLLPGHRGWMNRRGAIPSAAGDFDRQLASLVHDEMSAVERATGSPSRSVFLSSEGMIGARVTNYTDRTLFRPYMEPAIGQILRALQPEGTELILVARRQDRLMESCYIWEIQKGSAISFEDQFPYGDNPVIDFGTLLERLSCQPTVHRVTAVPFELIGAGSGPYVGHIGALAGATSLPDEALQARTSANESYSDPAVQIARKVNHLFERSTELRSLRAFLWTAYPPSRYPKASVLSDQEREAIVARYAECNRRLFQDWMSAYPVDSYSSDTATAALGDVLRIGANQ